VKVIFLDIDGVLCTGETVNEMVAIGMHHFCHFAKGPVYQLNKIVAETGAEIVVSSSWRCDGERWEALMTHFANMGVAKRPIGRTIDLWHRLPTGSKLQPQRGDEIAAWLSTDVTGFVVLDDDCDMDAVKDNFVHIRNGMWRGGLHSGYAEKAIAILNTPWSFK
jgi:hypothetical protein